MLLYLINYDGFNYYYRQFTPPTDSLRITRNLLVHILKYLITVIIPISLKDGKLLANICETFTEPLRDCSKN